ncbi:MAG: hypothetical protein ACTSQL_06175, partial [Promethearchaeota archaeon]
SWSSLDYYGRWKALHYYAKRFYHPIFPSVKEDNKSIEFWVSNDLRTTQELQFEWKILKSDGTVAKNGLYDLEVRPCSSKKLDEIDVSELKLINDQLTDFIIFFTLRFTNLEGEQEFHGFRLFSAPKKFPLNNPNISWELNEYFCEKSNEKEYELKLSTTHIALYVHIDSNKFDFLASDKF